MVHKYSLKTAYLGKIWFSSYDQKWLSAKEISVFFNCRYFINRLISEFEFWHVDRHGRNEQDSSQVFWKNFILGPKKVNPHNCASIVIIFLNFAQRKGLISRCNYFSPKKFCLGNWIILGPKMAHPLYVWIHFKNLFKILHNEKSQ